MGLEAGGTLSGRLAYDGKQAPPVSSPAKPQRPGKTAAVKQPPVVVGPLSGTISLDGLRLEGGSLAQPIQIQKAVLEPTQAADGKGEVLSGTANVPAGAPTPLAFNVQLTLSGYQLSVREPERLRVCGRWHRLPG